MELKADDRRESWRDVVPVLFLFYIPPIGVIVMWFIARWSIITKWILTILLGFVPLIILGTSSLSTYRFVQFQRSYAPVQGVQQALDIYGLQNGKYPVKLDELKPKFLKELPTDKEIVYTPTVDGKSYTLKAKLEGKEVELHPALSQVSP